jgi:ABC-2 type transport system ATP-binding protein
VAWELVSRVRERGATVLLVTHFMDEAQQLCDRLAVVRDGEVVAAGTVAELVAATHVGDVVRFTAGRDDDVDFLRQVPGVGDVLVRSTGAVEIRGSGPLLARVGHALVARGMEPADLTVQRPTLEEAYLILTGAPANADPLPGRGRVRRSRRRAEGRNAGAG